MLIKQLCICLGFQLLLILPVAAQQKLLAVKASDTPMEVFLSDLSYQSGVNIIFNDELIERFPNVTLDWKGITVDQILERILRDKPIGYRWVDDFIVLIRRSEEIRFSISGIISDSATGEPLITAYVVDVNSGIGTSTNNYGYFNLVVPKGTVKLAYGYLGYKNGFYQTDLISNKIVPLILAPDGLLKEIVVKADDHPDEVQPLHVPIAEKITLKDLQRSIHIGGASDLYRFADFIPGIHTGTDGIGGIHVRGGVNDQNLILMDGVPVYYPNHLLGIVSVFNYQVLQQASIYKSSFPSRFSGRLSSVIDVRTREGNIRKWGVSGNIGVSEVGMTVEGPLVKDQMGIILSGRFFLPGLVMPDITEAYKKRNGVGGVADLDYYDFNGKLNWKLGDRDRFFVSIYQGSDEFSDETLSDRQEIEKESGRTVSLQETFDKRLNWTNQTGVLRWNHILSDKIFSNFIISTSRFVLQSVDRSTFVQSYPGTNIDTLSGFATKEFKSSIEDLTARVELEIIPNSSHSISTGAYATRYKFKPKSVTVNEQSKLGDFFLIEGLLDDTYFSTFNISSLEAGIYLEDEWKVNSKWQVNIGGHLASFFVRDSRYFDPQLRLSIQYKATPRIVFSTGYSRMVQYLHLLTSSTIGLPTDLWVPTTEKVSPSMSDQYVINGRWKPANNLTIDLGMYYKSMRNLISYQEGASFLLKDGILPSSIVDAANWEAKITTGTGIAMGLELELAYSQDDFEINWNGTVSSSQRYFDELNNGKSFPDRYDRRFSSGLTCRLKLNKKWSIDANWLYGSGLAITRPISKFFNPGSFFPEVGISYDERNGYRLPAYHRLDLGIHYLLKETENFYHSVSLTMYNVYNRVNPIYITLIEDPVTESFVFRQFSLFKFFPSVSYRFAIR